jgi:hypothetical protein
MINQPPEYQVKTCNCVAYKEEIARLTKQRDELVAALNEVGEINKEMKYDSHITRVIRTALSKIKGE